MCFEIKKCEISNFFLLFQDCFGSLESLEIHVNFRWIFLFLRKMSLRREQDGREAGGCEEHLSHGYIRNIPSDTEVHAEQQLRVDRSIWPVEKNI